MCISQITSIDVARLQGIHYVDCASAFLAEDAVGGDEGDRAPAWPAAAGSTRLPAAQSLVFGLCLCTAAWSIERQLMSDGLHPSLTPGTGHLQLAKCLKPTLEALMAMPPLQAPPLAGPLDHGPL